LAVSYLNDKIAIMVSDKFSVSPEKSKRLEKRMAAFDIKESDITEKFIKAGGPGGQKVNKTSSCVYLKHEPSGIEVKCQQARSQSLNRFLARKILVEKIEERILNKKSRKQKEIAKKRRQKKKRTKRAKEKILKQKKIQSEKKETRKKIKP
jgi:peptide chain release factor